MTFLLLNLLQPRPRLSWVVIAAAVLAFAAGVALLVYFYKRYKRIEKETENDWDLSPHSLFVNASPPGPKIKESDTPASVEAEVPVAEEAAPVQTGGTRELASDLPSFVFATTVEPDPQVETPALEEPIQTEPLAPPEPRPTQILASPSLEQRADEPDLRAETAALEELTPPQFAAPREARPTEILTSPSLEQPATDAEDESAPFDEEIWAGLEIAEQPPLATEQSVTLQSTPEPLTVARVDQPAQREPFEPPRIDRISRSESYELPSTEPLTPREVAATRELRSTHISAGVAPRSRSFGSILGLPAEASNQPLILGQPMRPADETGIGALTHYGKDLGPKGGRGGTIALLIVVTLLCGAAGLYFFVPSVHSQVSAFIARLRGTQTEDRDAIKPKAQIIPSSRPEVNKNMVTARGAVDNISDEPLVNLEVEVSLQRGGDAPPEIRRIPVTPDPVPPGERGTFEFQYDGKRDTGFAGYTITRLFSNGTEVRFRTPAQK